MKLTRALLIACLLAVMFGCSNPPQTSHGESLNTTGKATNSARVEDSDGNVKTSEQVGYPAMNLKASGGGVEYTGGGVLATMSVGDLFSVGTPSDLVFENIKLQTGDTLFTADKLSATKSSVVAEFTEQVSDVTAAIEAMTEAEARRYVDSLVAVGTITEAVAEVALKMAFPTP